MQGRIVDTDPPVFALSDGRLYLFREEERRDRAVREPAILREAEARWPGLRMLTEGVSPG